MKFPPRRFFAYSSALTAVILVVLIVFVATIHNEYREQAGEYEMAQVEKMEVASEVLDRHGKLLGKFYILDRAPVRLDEISLYMRDAIVAAEDQRFWKHPGVDWLGVARAFVENLKSGRVTQGASTITQQLARNSFNLKGRNYKRKLLEMALAHRIEENYPKEKIMELYLNRIYFGSGFYGVEAASRGYFGISSKDLNVAQAATLAAIIRSPNNLSPLKGRPETLRTRNAVLRNMRDLGMLKREEEEKWRATPIALAKDSTSSAGSYALEMVRQETIARLGYEETMNGGLVIETSLDKDLQKKVDLVLEEGVARVEDHPAFTAPTKNLFSQKLSSASKETVTPPPDYLQSAAVVADNATGGILALSGGRSFKHSEYNRATQMSRPTGHALTPFLLLCAFEQGVFAGSVFQDWPLDNKFVGIGGVEGILGEWGVESRENQYEGPLTIREAFASGKNAAIARLGFRVGLEKFVQLSSRLGLDLPAPPLASFLLGSAPVSPLSLTRAYMVFPNKGEQPRELYIIQRIRSSTGETLFEINVQRERIVPPTLAYQVHSMMEEGTRTGPASDIFEDWGLSGLGIVGRAGTTYGFRDAWFAGYTPQVTCTVWVGFDLPATIFEGAFGSDLAGPIWAQVVDWVHRRDPGDKLLPPFGLKKVQVCPSTGALAAPECRASAGAPRPLREEYDILSEEERPLCPLHSGRIKSYTKEFDDSGWPRASQVADLSKVRPINVSSSYVTGQADPFGSVSPSSLVGASVEVALPAIAPDSATTPETQPPDISDKIGRAHV